MKLIGTRILAILNSILGILSTFGGVMMLFNGSDVNYPIMYFAGAVLFFSVSLMLNQLGLANETLASISERIPANPVMAVSELESKKICKSCNKEYTASRLSCPHCGER